MKLRNDRYRVGATKFAKEVYATTLWAGALGDRVPGWQDPVKKLHMRTDSDVVLLFAGELLAAKPDVALWRSKDTGGWLSPCALPSAALTLPLHTLPEVLTICPLTLP